MGIKLFTASLFVFVFPMICKGADPAPAAKQELANWWQKSSLSYGTLPARYLFHVEGTVSYEEASGNTEGRALDVRAGLDTRKGRITNRFTNNWAHRDMVYGFGGGSVDVTESTTRNETEYDLTRNALLVGGLEHYKNTLMFIDHRATYYGGIGVTVKETDAHNFRLMGGLGRAHFRFDRDGIENTNPEALNSIHSLEPSAMGSYYMQSWRWRISHQITMTQDSSLMEYFGGHLGQKWTLGFDFNIPISKRLSVAPAYRIRDEDNDVIRALGVKPQDRTFSFGLRFSL
jgi:putative salt-induced outer membrane protein YdiY